MTVSEAFTVRSSFVDYNNFELTAEQMCSSAAFMAGGVDVPQYEYSRLRNLYSKQYQNSAETLEQKKRRLRHAIATLKAARGSVAYTDARIDIHLKSHQAHLNRILMVEAAHRVLYAKSSDDRHKATQQFWRLNRRIYGSYDNRVFSGMLKTEYARLQEFQAEDDAAKRVVRYLRGFFSAQALDGPDEPIIFTDKLLGRLQDYVSATYEDVLASIPTTSDDIYYDADECKEVMQRSLEAGELAENGWRCEVQAGKACPSTDGVSRRIYLPAETRRTARELQRLILHEQEVHARRAENGRTTGISVLETGTACAADAEEGLGVLLECAVMGNSNNPSFHRARDRYITAGLALGADGHARNARQTFDVLWRLIAVRNSIDGRLTDSQIEEAKQIAYSHIHNAFRGTNFAMPGVIYAKLKIYYEGIRKNAQYFAGRSGTLEEAFEEVMIGKYNHTDPRERKSVLRLLEQM